MPDGDIFWFPACVTSITTNTGDIHFLTAADMKYERGTDNNRILHDAEHG